MSDNKVKKIGNVHTFQYCPYCGEELSKETYKVSVYKENIQVECPNHGVLM